MEHSIPQETLKLFLFGGHAEFSLKNEETGNRFVYYVTANDDNTVYFVRVLWQDAEPVYLGTLFEGTKFRPSKKSPLPAQSTRFKAFDWLVKMLTTGKQIPDHIKICHLGTCGCCGLPLTNERSILLGIGPVCLKKHGGF